MPKMNNTQRLALIKERLTTQLQPSYLEVLDESAAHHGHAGAQTGAGHFGVIISADRFATCSLIDCHRMVNAALNDLIPEEIHALRIQIKR